MQPIPFQNQTVELQPNPNQLEIDEKPVGILPIWTDGCQCISCWKLSIWERLQILFSGKVWLGIYSGTTQPPIWMSAETEKDIFVETGKPSTDK